MKLLLTSGGVSNDSIHRALVELLGKPIEQCNALCIPTAEWGHPWCTPASAWRFIAGKTPARMTELGWKSVGILELTALPSIGEERWVPWVREADVFLVDGGDATYLLHWMRESGFLRLMPSLTGKVWVGVSAGSMVMTPRIGSDFVNWKGANGDDRTLGLVDFSIYRILATRALPTTPLRTPRNGRSKSPGPLTRSTTRQRSRSSTAPSTSFPKVNGSASMCNGD